MPSLADDYREQAEQCRKNAERSLKQEDFSFLAIARRKLAETRGTPRKAVGRGFEKGRLAIARNRDLQLPAREGC